MIDTRMNLYANDLNAICTMRSIYFGCQQTRRRTKQMKDLYDIAYLSKSYTRTARSPG